MTREEGPERTQRTVAELLAKYGANSDESTPRRRRRRAEDAEETAPQAIIDRVLSDSGEIPRIRDEDQPPPAQAPPPPARGERHAAPTTRHRPVPQPAQQPPPPPPPAQQAASAPPAQPLPAPQPTQRQMPPVAPPERRVPERRQETRQTEQRRMPPQNSQPLPRPQPQPSGQWPAPPVDPGGLAARLDGRQESRSDLRNEPPPSPPMPEGATEVMPRIPDEPPAPGLGSGQHPVPHRVARTGRTPQPSMPLPQPPPAYPQHEPDEPDYPTEYHGFDPVPAESTQFVQGLEQEDDDEYDSGFSVEHDRPVGADDEFQDSDYPDGEDDSEKASPLRQWLSMAGQLAIGVIGGAALWLGFNWLWGKLPAAALIVALAVIVGLVWVVRKIRRADDLQTTILTVLVGLVVTVSPAAMLLLSR